MLPVDLLQQELSADMCCRETELLFAVSLSRENASVVQSAHIGMRCHLLASLLSKTSKTGRVVQSCGC